MYFPAIWKESSLVCLFVHSWISGPVNWRYETLYGNYGILMARDPNVVLSDFLHSVRISWQTRELVRWEQRCSVFITILPKGSNFLNLRQKLRCNNCGLLRTPICRVKVKQSVYRLGEALRAPRRLRLPEFLDSRYMKVASLSVLSTGRLYSPRDTPHTCLC